MVVSHFYQGGGLLLKQHTLLATGKININDLLLRINSVTMFLKSKVNGKSNIYSVNNGILT